MTRHVAGLHLRGLAFLGSDFRQYCSNLGAAVGLVVGDQDLRSRLISEALGPLTEWAGVRRALALGAAGSMVGALGGLYLWGFALGGRFGAFAALIFALGLDALSLMGRHLSFYPEIVAVWLLGSGLLALSAREPRRLDLFVLAALAVGLAPLVDLRGPAFGFAGFAALGWSALFAERARKLLHLAILAGVAAASWRAGRWVLPETVNFNSQMISVVDTALPAARTPGVVDPYCRRDGGFVWGRGDLDDLRSSWECSRGLERLMREKGPGTGIQAWALQGWGRAWLPLAFGGFVIAALGQVRRPWTLPVLLAGLAPWAAGWGIFSLMESDVRRAMTVVPPIAALLGGAFGAVAGEGGERPRWRLGLSLAALGLLVGLHSPWLRTWWRPGAGWRPVLDNRMAEWSPQTPLQGHGAAECRQALGIRGTPASRALAEAWIGASPD